MVGIGRDERAQVGGIKVGAGRNVGHDEPDDPAVPAHDERHAGLVLAEAHRAQRRQLDVGEDEPAMAGPGRSVASPGHPCGRGAGHRAAPQAVVARQRVQPHLDREEGFAGQPFLGPAVPRRRELLPQDRCHRVAAGSRRSPFPPGPQIGAGSGPTPARLELEIRQIKRIRAPIQLDPAIGAVIAGTSSRAGRTPVSSGTYRRTSPRCAGHNRQAALSRPPRASPGPDVSRAPNRREWRSSRRTRRRRGPSRSGRPLRSRPRARCCVPAGESPGRRRADPHGSRATSGHCRVSPRRSSSTSSRVRPFRAASCEASF